MKLRAGMWVVVADGARGIVLANEGTALAPELRKVRVYEQDVPRTGEMGRDQPPRTFASVGTRRSAQASPDLHQRAEDRFVGQIMGDLAADAANGAFESVVIVAPPTALGEMRKAAGPIAERVALWLDKDLTNHPVEDIQAAIVKALEG
jgi:protein required for attachment to host cells